MWLALACAGWVPLVPGPASAQDAGIAPVDAGAPPVVDGTDPGSRDRGGVARDGERDATDAGPREVDASDRDATDAGPREVGARNRDATDRGAPRPTSDDRRVSADPLPVGPSDRRASTPVAPAVTRGSAEPDRAAPVPSASLPPPLGVTASVRARSPRPVPTSAGALTLPIGLLREVPRRSADELLTLAPGVLTANHNGEGHAPTLYLRGFDAGEGQDVEITVDGIPINEPSNAHGHGYADPRFVIPELVRALAVRPGTFDPRQGDFAVAGSLDYQLGVPQRGVLVRGEYGAYDTRRLVLAWAPEDLDEGTFIGVELRDGQGFGPNRAHFGAAVLGRFEHRVDDRLRLFALAAVQSAQFDSAGVVRRDDVERGALRCGDIDPFFCAADPNQGGSTTRYLLGLGARWGTALESFETTVFGSLRQLRIRESFTGQLLDPRGDGLDEHYEVGTVGVRGAYRVRIPWDGRGHHVELGYFARHDTGETSAWRVRREDAVPYRTQFDADLALTDIGAWVMGDLSPVDWLVVMGGLRADAFVYSVVDRDLPAMDRTGERLPVAATDAMGLAVMPRGSVRVRLHEALTWVTSAGVGTRSSDAIALSEGESAPFAQSIGLETGLALALAEAETYRLEGRAGAFHAYVDAELVFDPERGRNVPSGSSNRYGAFGYARFRFERWLDVAASVAWTEANLGDGLGYFDLTAGDRLPYVPRVMGRVDAAARERFVLFDQPFGVAGGFGITWLGARPLPNGQEGGAYALVDASASLAFHFVEIGVLLRNLFDARYERASFSYASRFDASRPPSLVPAAHYAAGEPFTFFVTLTLHLTPVAWIRGDAPEAP